jgi:hypothetical protein
MPRLDPRRTELEGKTTVLSSSTVHCTQQPVPPRPEPRQKLTMDREPRMCKNPLSSKAPLGNRPLKEVVNETRISVGPYQQRASMSRSWAACARLLPRTPGAGNSGCRYLRRCLPGSRPVHRKNETLKNETGRDRSPGDHVPALRPPGHHWVTRRRRPLALAVGTPSSCGCHLELSAHGRADGSECVPVRVTASRGPGSRDAAAAPEDGVVPGRAGGVAAGQVATGGSCRVAGQEAVGFVVVPGVGAR